MTQRCKHCGKEIELMPWGWHHTENSMDYCDMEQNSSEIAIPEVQE